MGDFNLLESELYSEFESLVMRAKKNKELNVFGCSRIMLYHSLFFKDRYKEKIKRLLDGAAELTGIFLRDIVRYRGGHMESIKMLLECDIQLSHDILSCAVRYDKCGVEVIKLLLENGARLGSEALTDAVSSKGCNIEIIKLFLDRGVVFNNTILKHAVTSKYCNVEVLKLLVQRGARLHPYNLWEAVTCEDYNIEKIKFIMESGIEPWSIILNEAIQRGLIKVLSLLLDHSIRIHHDIIEVAVKCQKCSVEMLELLLENGAVITSDVLKCAVLHGSSIEVIKFLIECDATFNYDILYCVVRSKICNKELIKLFLENGAWLCDNILEVAFKWENCEIEEIKYLIEKGAIIAIDILCCVLKSKKYRNNVKVMKLLLESGAYVSTGIFEFFKIRSSNFQISKIILQYMLIQRLKKNKYIKKKTLQNYSLFKLSNCSNIIVYRKMVDFFECLKEEFFRMKIDKMVNCLSLFAFVSDRCSSSNVPLESKDSLVNKALLRYHSGKYPLSQNLFNASLSKSEIVNKICELNMHARKNNFTETYEKVSLDCDSITYIASFLDKDDCFNLMLAFYPGRQCNKKRYFLREADEPVVSSAKKLRSRCIIIN